MAEGAEEEEMGIHKELKEAGLASGGTLERRSSIWSELRGFAERLCDMDCSNTPLWLGVGNRPL